MSDTPRTDKAKVDQIGFFSCATVMADFARELERELNESILQLAGWERAAFMLREGMGLSMDIQDLRECLLTFQAMKHRAEQAEAERDEARAAIEIGQQNCDAEYERLKQERDTAQAKCTEMDDALRTLVGIYESEFDEPPAKPDWLKHALSDSCGSNFIRKDDDKIRQVMVAYKTYLYHTQPCNCSCCAVYDAARAAGLGGEK